MGTSGWQYDDWRGPLYPAELPRRRWFEHYASIFDTVELNSTFYRLPSPGTAERRAVELRDDTWICDEVFGCLHRHGAALCLHDMLASQPWVLTTTWTYLRFHGPRAIEDPYRGRYTARGLRNVAEKLEHWLSSGVDVFAYFNNDVGGAAVFDARWLAERLVQA